MEGLRRRIGFVTAVLMFAATTMPEAAAKRYLVGSRNGWSSNVNYTTWAQGKHFYNGDWLYFVYNRYQMSVLQVNKTNYEKCISDHPLHNWTTGAGRDVVPLNETKTYYIISGKGFCFGGMKLSVRVEDPPPPPALAPVTNGSPSLLTAFRRRLFVPALLTMAAAWDSFLVFVA